MSSQDQRAPKAGKKEKKAPPKTENFVNTTPPGDKKDMSQPMAPAYTPKMVEAAWYEWWEKEGMFSPDPDSDAPKFVLMLPPPNVTGSLHLGHTLMCSIEDLLTRWHRMKGHNTLWLPGVDHAGIATQVVVEKKIWNEKKQTRHDLGREQFVAEVWKWKEQYGNRICTQMRRTGASVDWTRECFTMDEKLSRAVTEAFIRLFNDGTIYRANKLVNWCCALKTAISNIEVEHVEIAKQTKLDVPGYDRKVDFGLIWSFAYPVEGSDERIIIATTRPETMLGDTAVAIHPEDPRYKHLHGKFIVHPFNGRRIPIICDPQLVNMEFGTGAVKVTPAHDPNDFECGKRHNLEFINILNDDGTLNENAAPFAGLKRFVARYKVLDALKEKGLFIEQKDHALSIAICSRSGDIIEPYIKPQWYCDSKEMARQSVQAVEDGRLKIIPDAFKGVWYRWLNNIQDWCISRQLWWGHRIPAYLICVDGVPATDESANWVVGHTPEEALANARAKRPDVDPSRITLVQDEDVLDTWFSSGLFPFSTLGWPDQTADLNSFYPGTLLETGHDILFFWVARMVMMGLKLTGQLPFETVYLHSIVRDKFGRKMSKSLGNVVDPIDVIEGITLAELHAKLDSGNLDKREVEKAKKGQKEQFPDGIAECGADALRFALLAYCSQGRDINLDINRVVGYRQFCNKLWNAVKFTMMHLSDFEPVVTGSACTVDSNCSLTDTWILSRLNACIAKCEDSLSKYDFADYTQAIYLFWLYELCDVYLEAIKPAMAADQSIAENKIRRSKIQEVLYTCVEHGLRLLHPAMPFVTEELWQRLPGAARAPHERRSIMINPFPTPITGYSNETAERDMEFLQQIAHKIRSIKGAYSLTNAQKPLVIVRCTLPTLSSLVESQRALLQTLSSCGDIRLSSEETHAGCAVEVVNENCTVFVMLKGLIDVEAELKKLDKKKEQLERTIDSLNKLMSGVHYAKVPDNIKEQNSEKLAASKKEIESIQAAIKGLNML